MADQQVPLSTATAAPSEVVIDGRSYIVSKLTLRDLGYVEQWMRDSIVASGRENIKDPELTRADKEVVLREAYNSAVKISLGSDYAEAMLESVEGLLRLVWMSLRKENFVGTGKAQHPITLDEVSEIVHGREELIALVDKAQTLSGFDVATGESLPDVEKEASADTSENPPKPSESESPATQQQSSERSEMPTDSVTTPSQA